jgi:penicillin-binding protein 2
MPSAQWKLKNYHNRWYPDETLDVAIGQGAVEATPLQLARIIGGIASDGHMVRPHVVFPDQLTPDFRKALLESFPGSGDTTVPIDPENWVTVTDGMAEVTEPGYFHTAGSAHLEGIDFGGKTGTAQVMSHEALGKTAKGKITNPNVWFVGVTPRRNPELVVAVLWQNGQFSYYPARIGAKIVSAYVEKQRRIANNLVPPKTAPPVEMTAAWSVPSNPTAGGTKPSAQSGATEQVKSATYLVDHGQIVGAKSGQAPKAAGSNAAPTPHAATVKPASPSPKPTAPHPSQAGTNPQPALAPSGKGQ